MSFVLEDSPARATSAVMAELVFEWLPTVGRNVGDGEWSDLTPYVSACTTSRGRTYALDQFEAGELTLTLEQTKTADIPRLFDPEYAAGPFYPHLIPMKQIRMSAVYSGTFYPVWRGYITDWGQAVESDAKFTVTITARDAFAALERIKLPSSAWALEVQKDDPTCWFRLGETDTLRITDSSAGGNYGLFGDTSIPGAQGLVVNDADGAAQFDHSPDSRCNIQTTPISGYPFAISVLMQLDGTDETAYHTICSGWANALSAGQPARLELAVPNVGFGGAEQSIYCVISDGTNARALYGTPIVTDGEIHHIVVMWETATSTSLYIDGAQITTGTGTVGTGAPSWPSLPYWALGNYPDIRAFQGSFGFGNGLGPSGTTTDATRGVLDEFIVYDGTTLSATRIAALSLAALNGWDGDDTGTRVERFLDVIEWPDALRDIDTGVSVLGPASWSAGTSALAAMQAWADTELGAFFTGKDGKIVWRSRHYPYLDTHATVSQATIGDKHSNATLNAVEIILTRDEALIRNPVTASRTGGVTVTVKDETLIDTKYGDLTWAAPNSEDQLDSAIRDRALWILARYKELGTRLETLVLDPTIQPALWPYVLGLEIGDRITIKRTKLGIGNETVTDQIIERIEHRFTPFTAHTLIVGSPVDPNVGDYLILDDATYGLLDSFALAY